MKKLTIALAMIALASGPLAGTTGSWTLKNTSSSYSSFLTASNWLNSYVPTNANDSLEFKVTSDNTKDRGNPSRGAIFGNVLWPTTSGEHVRIPFGAPQTSSGGLR